MSFLVQRVDSKVTKYWERAPRSQLLPDWSELVLIGRQPYLRSQMRTSWRRFTDDLSGLHSCEIRAVFQMRGARARVRPRLSRTPSVVLRK